ncbi:GNAT family N-acetyltransferase [Frankia sp. R82]|uniref:GNAT family N-acetyltransferase n=1 Tax=Frankia sp. R82 TaxID=2950553 RepID=UPI002043ECB2|nr:GNAT family N-acetyltransferase [Frankia sp. R82]MCM3886549.1 GNAT family N-acetyltransferase [Frankia sp. R82]
MPEVEDDHGLAGFLIALPSPSQPHVAYIHFLGVRSDQRGFDLARRRYGDFFHRMRAAGCREVHAITGPSNTDSIAFHRRLGFAIDGPIPEHNGPGRPTMIFRRFLADES